MGDTKRRGPKPRRVSEQPASPGQEPGQTPAPGEAQWVTREEALVFPTYPEPAEPPAGRIVLPPSGTAEEILGREAAMAVPLARSEAPAKDEVPGPASPAARTTLSFFGTDAREEARVVEASEHLATFFLDREEYGVDVRLVQEIIRISEITPVPRAPPFIRGVINLRGRIIPVVDLKRKLCLGEFVPARASRIVVARLRERLIGVLVDAAAQVLRVPVSAIEPAPEEAVEIAARFIRGVAKLERRLIILIDLPRVLQLDAPESVA